MELTFFYRLAKWKLILSVVIFWDNSDQHTCQDCSELVIYAPMDETIGRNVSLSHSDFNLCVLGLPYNLAGYEPLGYMFSYCSLLEKPFLFKVNKNIWSFPFLPVVGSEGSFKNFDVLLLISYKFDIYIALLTIITLLLPY